MGRVDRGCNLDDPAHIKNEPMRKLIDTGFGFVPPGDIRTTNPADVPPGPCARGDVSFREKFRQASVASGEGDYVYPHTMVWFVVEGIDSGGAAALGATYYDLLVKSGSPLVGRTVVPGVDHSGLVRTRSGAEKIRDVLLNECRPR